MAKQFNVTLAKCASYLDMASGKSWKKNQTSTMGASKAARYQSNPRFVVVEVAEKAKAKVEETPADDELLDDDEGGEDVPPAPSKKKKSKKKSSTKAD